VKSNIKFSSILYFLRHETVVTLLIIITAILLRAGYCWEIYGTPFFSGLIGDPSLFDSWAQEIVKGKWMGEHVVLQPFYPYFLAAIYFIVGHNLFAVRIIQIAFGALSCLIIARVGHYFFSREVGILAGFFLALYPSAVFFDCLIRKAVFGVFFISLLLLMLGKIIQHQRYHLWFFSGIILGLLVLVRENSIILAPALILWILIHFRHQSKKALTAWILLLIIGLATVFIPVGLKNMLNTGKFTVGASHFGSNLYMGNNPKAKGTYVPLAIGRGNIVSELEDITNIAEKNLGKRLTPAEVSHYWTNRTLTYIQSDPLHWIRLLIKKWFLVWNYIEIGDTVDIYGHAQQSRILLVLNHILHLGILLPLAVMGICVTWKDREKLWLLYLMMLSYAASLTFFFVFSRYRFPMAVIIILFAAAGIINLRSYLKKCSTKSVLLIGSLVLCSVLFSNWQIVPSGISSATTYYNLAKAYEGSGENKKSVQYYEAALKIVPNFALAHNNIGTILMNNGRKREAIHHFHQAISTEPDFADAYNNLGAALSSVGKRSEAIRHLEKALLMKPNNANIHNNLGVAFFKEGRLEKAFSHFQQAYRLEPNNTAIAHNLSKVEEQIKTK
jgi:Tfp pilus assembly protein PilF/4-amino-4-deoxy-L-arabinose transferase-like glycosyltransferase